MNAVSNFHVYPIVGHSSGEVDPSHRRSSSGTYFYYFPSCGINENPEDTKISLMTNLI